jgi:hypothetical protein
VLKLREAMRDPLREAVRDPLREAVRDPLREAVRDPLREAVRGVAEGLRGLEVADDVGQLPGPVPGALR